MSKDDEKDVLYCHSCNELIFIHDNLDGIKRHAMHLKPWSRLRFAFITIVDGPKLTGGFNLHYTVDGDDDTTENRKIFVRPIDGSIHLRTLLEVLLEGHCMPGTSSCPLGRMHQTSRRPLLSQLGLGYGRDGQDIDQNTYINMQEFRRLTTMLCVEDELQAVIECAEAVQQKKPYGLLLLCDYCGYS